MTTKRQPSLTKAADPVIVVIGSTLDTSSGSVAFNGLEKGVVSVDEVTRYIQPQAEVNVTSEETTVSPVAGDEDFTLICAWCSFMSHLGRGPVSHNICKPCRIEFFPEVPLAD